MDYIFPVDYSKIYIRTVEELSIPTYCTLRYTALTKSCYSVINSGNMGTDGTGLGLHVQVLGYVLDSGCQLVLC